MNQHWIEGYTKYIEHKAPLTIDAYIRVIRQLLEWLSLKPGGSQSFQPDVLTKTAVSTYLKELEARRLSIQHRIRVKSAISTFSEYLIESGFLHHNPTSHISIPNQALLAPRVLTDDQRYILKTLVERERSARSEAIFALGYWAGCRVSDVSWMLLQDTHIGPKIGTITVGYKNEKQRTIPILNEVRRPLMEYLNEERIKSKFVDSPYVFLSKRGGQLTEKGIHHWLRTLKAKARKNEWELIKDITFHDLRHDFAHRARESEWPIEYISVYLGHITKRGEPAIQTTSRYTNPNMERLREKLKNING